MNQQGGAAGNPYRPFKEVLPALLLLAALFLLNFISRVIFSPLLPVIEIDLGLSHSASGSLFLFISAGYCLSIIFSGYVSSRISHKNTIVFSAVSSGVVLMLLTFCETLTHLRIALFCLGLSAGLYLPSGLASITAVVSPAYLARGMAIHELAPNIGFVLAPVLSAFLMTWLSWSGSLLLVGLVLIAAAGAYWVWYNGSPGYGTSPNRIVCKEILCTGDFWLMVVLFSMAICSTLGLYAMLPLYLVADRNFEQVEANNLVALSRVFSVFMPLAGGWIGDRLGNRNVVAFVLCGAGLLTVPIGVCSGVTMLIFIVLQPMVAVCYFPSAFAVLSRIGPDGAGNLAVSLCIPLAFLIGGGVMPTMIGIIGDHFSLGTGFVTAGVGISSAGLLALFVLARGTGKTIRP